MGCGTFVIYMQPLNVPCCAQSVNRIRQILTEPGLRIKCSFSQVLFLVFCLYFISNHSVIWAYMNPSVQQAHLIQNILCQLMTTLSIILTFISLWRKQGPGVFVSQTSPSNPLQSLLFALSHPCALNNFHIHHSPVQLSHLLASIPFSNFLCFPCLPLCGL